MPRRVTAKREVADRVASRVKKHADRLKESGGKRTTISLKGESVKALETIRRIEGDESDGAAINRVLVERERVLLVNGPACDE